MLEKGKLEHRIYGNPTSDIGPSLVCFKYNSKLFTIMV